jgi:hypothetical protein
VIDAAKREAHYVLDEIFGNTTDLPMTEHPTWSVMRRTAGTGSQTTDSPPKIASIGVVTDCSSASLSALAHPSRF